MSGILNSVGGGNQTVKAVLEALGTNYVVEKWVSEDGTQRYQRWANGRIEVVMYVTTSSTGTKFTYPISFTKKPLVHATPVETDSSFLLQDVFTLLTTTGGSVDFVSRGGDIYLVTEFILKAEGY